MRNITSSEKDKAPLRNAPKKCIKFILDYSKSYHVVEVSKNKIGLHLN